MAENKDQTLTTLTGGTSIAIQHAATSIENITTYLDESLHGLEASKLPEYRQAIDAIQAYKNALVQRMIDKSKE